MIFFFSIILIRSLIDAVYNTDTNKKSNILHYILHSFFLFLAREIQLTPHNSIWNDRVRQYRNELKRENLRNRSRSELTRENYMNSSDYSISPRRTHIKQSGGEIHSLDLLRFAEPKKSFKSHLRGKISDRPHDRRKPGKFCSLRVPPDRLPEGAG